jgi:hypothetical protein
MKDNKNLWMIEQQEAGEMKNFNGLGMNIVSGLTWTITALTSVIRYKQGKWKKKSLVEHESNIAES